MLDTLRNIETPEGVELNLRTAGIHPRAIAWLLDTALRTAIYMIAATVASVIGGFGIGLLFLLMFVGEWFYPVLFEVYGDGATPGKRAIGLRVVHDDGTPVRAGASLIRNLLRAVDFFPFAYLSGLIAMLVHPDFKRLGDLAAGTVVVHEEHRVRKPRPRAAQPIAPRMALTLPEQEAIGDFADRGENWSKARLVELADLAEPVTGVRGEEGVVRLLGIASWQAEER